MSKPNLLFYANKLGAEKSASFFCVRLYKEQGYFVTFVEFLEVNVKGGLL